MPTRPGPDPQSTGANRTAPLFVFVVIPIALVALLGCGPGLASAPTGQNLSAPSEPAVTFEKTDPARFSSMISKVSVDRNDPVAMRILSDYGAVFVTGNGAVPPPVVIFRSADEVSTWQTSVAVRRENIGKYSIELQAPAMEALLAARAEARAKGLDITPRGSDAARRDYPDTVKLWRSRVEPALKHWVALKKLAPADAARIRALAPHEQVPEVLALEERGLWFNTDFSKSILYSVAAPGTSQHLSMLALDVAEFENARVREVLAHHGWFQTVQSDLPHFTYLGVDASALPSLGLKRVSSSGREFWIPDL